MASWVWTVPVPLAVIGVAAWMYRRHVPCEAESAVRRFRRTMTIQEYDALREWLAIPDAPEYAAYRADLTDRAGEDLVRRASDRFEGTRQRLKMERDEFLALARRILNVRVLGT